MINYNRPGHPAAEFVHNMHTQIFKEFYDQINNNKNNLNIPDEDEQEAQVLEKFLNDLNKISQNQIIDEDIETRGMLETILGEIKNVAPNGISQAGLFAKISKMNSKAFGLYCEKLVTAAFQGAINVAGKKYGVLLAQNSKALNIGAEVGLPTLIEQLGQSFSSSLANAVAHKHIASRMEHSLGFDNTLLANIQTQRTVQPVQQKADIATVVVGWEFVSNTYLKSVLKALSKATFSQKTYNIKSWFSNQGMFSLGKTQSTISLFPSFLQYGLGQGLSNTQIRSVYFAALNLARQGNGQIIKQLNQISWLYDLKGNIYTSYKNNSLSWVENILAEQGGVKFFIAIDNNTGNAKVRTIRSIIIQNLLDEMKNIQGQNFFFGDDTKRQTRNVLHFKYVGW